MSWNDREPDIRHQIEARCAHCGEQFHVARSLEGGLVNCPSCQKLVEIARFGEPLYWLYLAGTIIGGLIFTAIVTVTGGPIAGAIAFLICAAIIIVSQFAL